MVVTAPLFQAASPFAEPTEVLDRYLSRYDEDVWISPGATVTVLARASTDEGVGSGA